MTKPRKRKARTNGYRVTGEGNGYAVTGGPLTNAEKQARWRKRHADQRRRVARIATMLMRRSHTVRSTLEFKVGWNHVTVDTYFLRLADLICAALKTDRAIKQLRWALAKSLRDRQDDRYSKRARAADRAVASQPSDPSPP